MIFLVENYKNKKTVDVYTSLNELTSMIEWQDILGDAIIIDESGNVYKWDNTKKEEIEFTELYSMKVVGKDIALANQCTETYQRLNGPTEFFL